MKPFLITVRTASACITFSALAVSRIDLVAKRHARRVLAAFDKLEHEQRRAQAETRVDVERKARNIL